MRLGAAHRQDGDGLGVEQRLRLGPGHLGQVVGMALLHGQRAPSKSSTAAAMAIEPVDKVGSRTGAKRLECKDGMAGPPAAAAATASGATAPRRNK
ncbi:MAG: hypothetical protein ACK56I_35235, partial [bacterium]